MEEREPAIGPWGRINDDSFSPQVELPSVAAPAPHRAGRVVFFGNRRTLIAILLRGYVLTLLTAGIYRFWLVTQKRRFYWSNTVIDGHPLEYTGRSIQLLIGFLLAILVFIPLYGGAFYLTTVYYELAAFAYIGMLVVLYFLAGYALYRGRRFRLTRTLWRGIRFGQTGNAWVYAIRRFLWILATVLTLGLTYPMMAVSLYKYRFENTWFGNRQFSFTGRARDIAGPFFLVYAVLFVLAVWLVAAIGSQSSARTAPQAATMLPLVLIVLVTALSFPWLRARIETRMLSAISVGEAKLTVSLRARTFYGQYLVFGLFASLCSFLFLMILGFFMQAVEAGMLAGIVESVALFGRGIGSLVLFAVAYLSVLATYALLWDVIFSFGYWKMVARDAVIENIESLRTVRAGHEESPVIGEGLADALNVGAY